MSTEDRPLGDGVELGCSLPASTRSACDRQRPLRILKEPNPIPSVSKKLVTAPRTIVSTRGHAARATAPCSNLAAQITPASAKALSNVMSMAPPGVADDRLYRRMVQQRSR